MATAFLAPDFWTEYLRFRDAFAEVLDPVFYDIAWLDGQVWSGIFKLFTSENAAILVSVKCYPTGSLELNGEIAAGNLFEIVEHLIPLALEYGKSVGCCNAVIESRAGWLKVMRKSGWELHQTKIRKSL